MDFTLTQEFEQLLRIIAEIGRPCAVAALPPSKQRVFSTIANFVEADFWEWRIVPSEAVSAGDWTSSSDQLSAGWPSATEQEAAFICLQDSPSISLDSPSAQAVAWDGAAGDVSSQCDEKAKSHGIVFIRRTHPAKHGFSITLFGRRRGRPSFERAQSSLVGIAGRQIDWLHTPLPRHLHRRLHVSITPRANQVLTHLLQGETNKAIAERLGLSEFTIGDYVKQFFRRYEVRSRAELFALFMSNAETDDSRSSASP